jgi:hypothetical protein
MAAVAALALACLVALLLVGAADASVKGPPPRRFTFLRRLPRIRPSFRRLRTTERYVIPSMCGIHVH